MLIISHEVGKVTISVWHSANNSLYHYPTSKVTPRKWIRPVVLIRRWWRKRGSQPPGNEHTGGEGSWLPDAVTPKIFQKIKFLSRHVYWSQKSCLMKKLVPVYSRIDERIISCPDLMLGIQKFRRDYSTRISSSVLWHPYRFTHASWTEAKSIVENGLKVADLLFVLRTGMSLHIWFCFLLEPCLVDYC